MKNILLKFNITPAEKHKLNKTGSVIITRNMVAELEKQFKAQLMVNSKTFATLIDGVEYPVNLEFKANTLVLTVTKPNIKEAEVVVDPKLEKDVEKELKKFVDDLDTAVEDDESPTINESFDKITLDNNWCDWMSKLIINKFNLNQLGKVSVDDVKCSKTGSSFEIEVKHPKGGGPSAEEIKLYLYRINPSLMYTVSVESEEDEYEIEISVCPTYIINESNINEAGVLMFAGIGLAIPEILKLLGKLINSVGKIFKLSGVSGQKLIDLGEKLHHKIIHLIELALGKMGVKDKDKQHKLATALFYMVVGAMAYASGTTAVKAFKANLIDLSLLEAALTAIKNKEIGEFLLKTIQSVN